MTQIILEICCVGYRKENRMLSESPVLDNDIDGSIKQ